MSILEEITAELADTSNPVTAAGAAFELIRQIANEYAVPGAAMFALWGSVTIAACDGRSSLGCPVVAFPHEVIGIAGQMAEDVAAEALADLAVTVQHNLEAAARQESSPDTQHRMETAAAAASEIRELLETDSLWPPSPSGRSSTERNVISRRRGDHVTGIPRMRAPWPNCTA